MLFCLLSLSAPTCRPIKMQLVHTFIYQYVETAMATKWQKVKSNLYFLNNERIAHSLPGGTRLGWERQLQRFDPHSPTGNLEHEKLWSSAFSSKKLTQLNQESLKFLIAPLFFHYSLPLFLFFIQMLNSQKTRDSQRKDINDQQERKLQWLQYVRIACQFQGSRVSLSPGHTLDCNYLQCLTREL